METNKTTKKKTKILDTQRLITPVFRVAFPNVFKAAAMRGGTPKFSVTMLFPKDADLSALRIAMKAAKVQAHGSNKNNWPEMESPVRDGDKPSPQSGQIYEGFPGHWVIRASSNENSRPGVFDEDVSPIVDPGQFYPGCYAKAYVFAYCWEFGGRHGVGFILDHVQKQRDGKPFGGKKPGEQVFSPVNTGESEDETSDEEVDANADF